MVYRTTGQPELSDKEKIQKLLDSIHYSRAARKLLNNGYLTVKLFVSSGIFNFQRYCDKDIHQSAYDSLQSRLALSDSEASKLTMTDAMKDFVYRSIERQVKCGLLLKVKSPNGSWRYEFSEKLRERLETLAATDIEKCFEAIEKLKNRIKTDELRKKEICKTQMKEVIKEIVKEGVM